MKTFTWTDAQIEEVTNTFISTFVQVYNRKPSKKEFNDFIQLRLKYPPSSESIWKDCFSLNNKSILPFISLGIKYVKNRKLLSSLTSMNKFFSALNSADGNTVLREESICWMNMLEPVLQ